MLVAQHMRAGPVLVSERGTVMGGGFQAEEWGRGELRAVGRHWPCVMWGPHWDRANGLIPGWCPTLLSKGEPPGSMQDCS